MGPLEGIKVIEFSGIGPAPFAGMMLADMGADVVVIERPRQDNTVAEQIGNAGPRNVQGRGKRSIALDLKKPGGVRAALRLIEQADAIIESYRPGKMEELGLGPEICLRRNAKLVYGRMTGWGQSGPLAQAAAHELNYVALTGVLSVAARGSVPPLLPTSTFDMGAGGMYLAFGIVCAVLEATRSGKGQVIDAAIIDGTVSMAAVLYNLKDNGINHDEAKKHPLRHDSHFYETYECADGKFITLAALEPQFYRELIEKLALHDVAVAQQYDQSQWPAMKSRLAALFRTKTRDEWCTLLEGSDACFAPMLDLQEAPRHRHNLARSSFYVVDGMTQPAPAPRFSRTPARVPSSSPIPGEHTAEVLREYGFSEEEIAAL